MAADQPAKRPRPVMSKRSTPGVLSDDDIHAEVSRGHLIVSGFKRENIHQSCYELRVGSIYYDLSDNSRRIELTTDQYVLLKPFQQVAVITHEVLAIPSDVVGRVLLKGHLFSLGISPVHTYADPGFSGVLGIVLCNLSQNYIKLDQGQAIAK